MCMAEDLKLPDGDKAMEMKAMDRKKARNLMPSGEAFRKELVNF